MSSMTGVVSEDVELYTSCDFCETVYAFAVKYEKNLQHISEKMTPSKSNLPQ